MVSFGKIVKDRTNPRQREFAGGKSPYRGSLGQNKTPDDPLKDPWTAKMRDNVDWRDFASNAYTFPGEIAAASQAKIDNAAWEPRPNFTNPGDNAFAQNFLDHYLDRGDGNSAEGRGMIEGDRLVRHENLDQFATTSATSASAKRDPNVVGEFPRDDVAV